MLSLSVSVASRETERSAKVLDVSTPQFQTMDDAVGDCGLCARTWAVSDVRDEIRAHKTFKWLFMLGVFGIVIGGVLTVGEVYVAGLSLLAISLASMVRGVFVSRKTLWAIPKIGVDQHNEQAVQRAQKESTRSVRVWLWTSPWVSGVVIYFFITRGVWMGILLATLTLLGVGVFAGTEAFRRRYKREVRCPTRLKTRLSIAFMNKNLDKTLEMLTETWLTTQPEAGSLDG